MDGMVLVTGCAGFIGFHLSKKLLSQGFNIVGVDNINDYYDINLKKSRLDQLKQFPKFCFEKIDIADRANLEAAFKQNDIKRVVNLAAQAGVRYSIENPYPYMDSNLLGFLNILECCRHNKIEHLVFASTSSAYGANTSQPFDESQHADHPMSLYAATKRANELMAHSYASLYNLPCTALRFFTVYGPWGRPDMALFKFTKNILENKPIDVYNHGNMKRDFTYVDDIVEGVVRALRQPAASDETWDGKNPNPAISYAPYRLYNIGNSSPTPLTEYIQTLELALGKKAIYNMMPMQAGDIASNYADTTRLQQDLDYKPQTTVAEGIGKFVEWYMGYYQPTELVKENGNKAHG